MGAITEPCREYQGGAGNQIGHKKRTVDGKQVYVHRWVFEQIDGPLLPGEVVRHRCDNPACFRYSHLERGTQADNLVDMRERGRARNGKERDHCPHGHPYDEANTYWRKDRPGHRECRACRRGERS